MSRIPAKDFLSPTGTVTTRTLVVLTSDYAVWYTNSTQRVTAGAGNLFSAGMTLSDSQGTLVAPGLVATAGSALTFTAQTAGEHTFKADLLGTPANCGVVGGWIAVSSPNYTTVNRLSYVSNLGTGTGTLSVNLGEKIVLNKGDTVQLYLFCTQPGLGTATFTTLSNSACKLSIVMSKRIL